MKLLCIMQYVTISVLVNMRSLNVAFWNPTSLKKKLPFRTSKLFLH